MAQTPHWRMTKMAKGMENASKMDKNDQDGTRTRNLCQSEVPESNALPLGHPTFNLEILWAMGDDGVTR